MKRNGLKKILILLVLLYTISLEISVSAHSGRTDSNGGHKDNKNVSGLGSYHYHCDGYPAHLHENGACPYSLNNTKATTHSSNDKDTKSEDTSSTSNNSKTSKEPIRSVESIKIYGIERIEAGGDKKLTAFIEPSNSTDKSITWESSDESIAEVDKQGKLHAKNPGTVYITATSSNGIKDKIKITVKNKKTSNVTYTNNINDNNLLKNNQNNKEANDKGRINYFIGFIVIILVILGSIAIYNRNKNKNLRN